ncbi:aggregation-promoting factor C-terminal-like domain-containing protein [Streptomyces paradoxus]|uniref:aggregation-promoting factor C-terminal-like domain-containing protein n=1 Tax=Streptomyces paradoxus TaxID=66375 RepID=UPI0037FFB6C3
MPDLDIVGTVAVDVVPIVPNFHSRLKAAVLPAADRVGREAGERIGDQIGRQIATSIPSAVITGGNAARNASRRAGNDNAGAFGRAFKSRLEVAFRSLPRPDVRLSTTGFDADLARVRARMETLSNKRIGIDIDEATALAQIEAIDAELARLGARSPSVQIRTDVAAARAELAAVHGQLNDLDRDDVNIRVTANTAQANAALLQLAVALGAVAAIPLVPIAAAGIGAIASAAVAAGAGVGAVALVAVPAIKGVTSAITAKSAAEKESATATNNAAAATVRAAQNAMQMVSAQAALRNAHRQAAQSIAQANRQIEDAERAVAQAAQRAMEQRRQAAESVERAERSLADAKRQARQAEEDLTQARKDAAQQLRDLNDQLLDGMLDQRDATLRVQEAQEELDRVLADPTSSDLQRERAQLGYDEAVRNADKQKQKQAELKKSVEEANKAGINGNEGVKRALEQQADAQQNVKDQTDALARAHQDAARAEVEAAQTVADAQRSLADAVTNAANTQVQAAESIASAERGVEAARLSSIDTTSKAASKADEYRKTLAKLTPEQRALFDSIAGPRGLTAAFKEWSKELSPDVLPLFTRMVNGAKGALPGLTPLVENSADAIGELFDRASADLKSPFWQRFKRGIAESAKPAIVGLGISFGNVFKGMAGVVDAFFPHMDSISDRMQKITGRLADWGTGLRGSPQFERFLDYAAEMGPIVAETLGDIGGAFFEVGQALSPLSGPLFRVLGAMASGIATIAENAPWLVQGIWLAVVATKAWTIAMAAFNFVVKANPIVRIAILIGALVGLVVLAYNRFGWFRTAVQATWAAIQTAALWAWNSVLKPVFFAIRDAVTAVGNVALWLWRNAFQPALSAIWLAARVLFAVLVTAVFTPIILAAKLVGAIAMWLWTDCFKPSFDGIATIAQWLWSKILSPVFGWIWGGIKWVGDKFLWLYNHGVAPAANWIRDKAGWLWAKALQPAFKWIWDGLKWVGEKFSWLYDKAVKPVADWVADKAGWLYRKGLKPAFDSIRTAVGLVGDAFESARKSIKSAFDKIVGITARPVNFVIDFVYTKGIKAVWDKVASFVGLGKLPDAPKLVPEKFADGGRTRGGIPGKDSIPALLMADEYVLKRDSARKIGFSTLEYMNRHGEMPGVQRFADGGLVGALGSAWDWTRDTVSDAVGKGVDWAKAGVDILSNPSKVWSALTSPLMEQARKSLGSSKIGKTLAAYPTKMAGGLKDKIVDAVNSMFSGGGGGGPWIKPVNVAYGTPFGKRGSMWSSGRHTGLDFPAPTGTPVHAVADGQVTGAASGGPYGNHVIVSHGGGLASLYAHLSKILTSVGKGVRQGQTIGNVGATGNVTGPHLHLEARLNGRAVDPMSYLSGGGGFGANAVGAAQRYAKGMLGQYGWGPDQFGPLKKLWEGESNWRWNAKNPSSGAYGIPQALPATKMASAGADWRTNPQTQIRWGLGYIKGRPDYGSPAAAYQKWLSRSPHWYDSGGYLEPGLNLVANGTGRPEPVFTSGQWSDIRASKGGGGPITVNVESKTYLDGREIGGFVDQRIDVNNAEMATALTNGRNV